MRLALTLLLVTSFGAHAQVYRCGNSYSTAPCPGAKTVDVTPQGSVVEGAGPTRKIFLCKSYGGQQFWSRDNCYQRGGSTLVREVSVPRNMSWDDQVTTAQRAHREAESLQRPPAGVQSTSNNTNTAGRCDGIRQALANNQAAARAGGSSHWMDHLAAERHRLNDQRIAMRC